MLQFSFPNPLEKTKDENEDALNVQNQSEARMKFVALADGAGGAGIYCKDWARCLVDQASKLELPISDESLDEWILAVSKLFYRNMIDKVDMDIYTREKFLISGSYSTLVLVWIDDKNYKCHYSGTGDSCVFIFRKGDDRYDPILLYPYSEFEFLDQNPHLVNWRKKNNLKEIKTLDLQKDDMIFIGTDAIARWILLILLKSNSNIESFLNSTLVKDLVEGHSFKNLKSDITSIDKLYVFLQSQNEIQLFSYFKKLIECYSIEADDLTLFAYTIP